MTSLNWNKQFALVQVADDVELLEELLKLFQGSCSHDIKLIKEGLESSNPEKVKAAAHSIKGAAASLGMDGIRDIALSIEIDARGNSLETAREQVSKLELLCKELGQL